jgi:hypothetical protein
VRRRRLRNAEELEQAAGIERTVPPSHTQRDVEILTRKVLGPLWGRKRRKYEGP